MASTQPFVRTAVWLLCAVFVLSGDVVGQDTDEYFQTYCASCHTIGGGTLSGPDLKDVESRKDREWLIEFILDPQAKMDAGDPYALKMKDAARGVIMPKAAGIDRARARKLLDLIAAESKLERSRFAGVSVSDRPLTADDVVTGRQLFLGERRLLNGGPPCMACHTVSGLDGLGGGLLGPDLSDAYARLDGRKSLVAWLASPATEVMAPVFRKHPIDIDTEILPLVAFFEDAVKKGEPPEPDAGIEFLVLGVMVAAAILLGCDALWRRRFTSVRRKLTRGGLE